MSKKKYILILLLLVIIIISSIYFTKSKSSISNDNNFHINDISRITKIFIADRENTSITLTKHNEEWIVNDLYTVRKQAISTLLNTANKIRIKRPVSKNSFENVIKFMATSGILVEFYEDDKMIKSYTIGSNTPNHLGSYMLLKDGKTPFIVHIPTFNGFLSPKFGVQANRLNINNWRSHNVFDLSLDEINYVRYTDLFNKRNSFIITNQPLKLFNFKNIQKKFNQNKILSFLNSFKGLNCETFKTPQISELIQINELVVNKDTLRIYDINDNLKIKKEANYTVKRKYANLNNGEYMIIQDYVFNKVLINIDELTD